MNTRTGPSPAARVLAPDVTSSVERLWAAVAEGSESRAAAAVFGALEAGLDPESVLLDVIAPVQMKVGTEWAANRMTVAQEHAATAVNDRVTAALAHHPAVAAAAGEPRGRVTVACVDGEWHAFPARLLAQTLTLRGWQVDYLGAQVPTPHLIAHLHRTAPVAVALSASLATRLPTAHAAVSACQAAGTPVLVGGAAFGPQGRYATLIGADAWAPDARAAADRLDRGMGTPRSGHQPLDDLPHLADQEYSLVSGSSHRLVGTVLRDLGERVPAMRSYTAQQREHTAEDLAHIVEFLATALYTGDPELFVSFIRWTAGILTARGVPGASLRPALDLLGRELRDLPRALAALEQAGSALTGPAAPASSADDHGRPA